MFALLAPAYYVAPQYAHVRGWTHQLPFYTQVGPGPRASGATPRGQRQHHLQRPARRGCSHRAGPRARGRAGTRATDQPARIAGGAEQAERARRLCSPAILAASKRRPRQQVRSLRGMHRRPVLLAPPPARGACAPACAIVIAGACQRAHARTRRARARC